jgi:hypothetical protein
MIVGLAVATTSHNALVLRLGEAMQIPSNVYTKYDEAMSMFSSLDNFGVACQLVYQKISPISSTPADIRQRLTMNPQAGQAGMVRGGEATKVVETTQDITLRVYSDKKSFEKVGGFDYAAGSCMTIGTSAQTEDIRKADYIIIDKVRLQRSGEVLVWGLNTDYCIAHWKK